jgi:prepilin peptidase CpaA
MVNVQLPRTVQKYSVNRAKVNQAFRASVGHISLNWIKFALEWTSHMLHTLSVSLLPALMIVAAMTDATTYKIPNWLTALTAVLFFPMAFLTSMPLNEFGLHVLAGVVLFLAGYILFALRLFGGGDAKLMAAAGLWFGAGQSLNFLIFTAVAGGVLAIAIGLWSVFSMFWQYSPLSGKSALDKSIRKIQPKLPYGFALCVGAIIAFPNTWWTTVN